MHWHQLRSQIFHVFQVTSHIVGIFHLCTSCRQFNLSLYQFIQFLTCTRIPCRDSHCENGLVRCCLYILLELILHEVWPSLFEILQSLDLYNRFPNDWNQVVAEDHERNCRENLFCFLAFALQILLLQKYNPYVRQGTI